MKKCAYCATINRDEAIFCTRCKRPLQTARKDHSARSILVWILVIFVLIGLSSTLFSPRLFPAPIPTPVASGIGTAAPTRTREPITLSACVNDTTRIRRGPGTQYETTGGLLPGTCLTILGRNEEADWVYIVSNDHQTGWVAASLLPNAGDLGRVSVRDAAAMENSSRPTLTSAEIAHGAEIYLTEVAATTVPQSPLSRYVVPCFQTAGRIGDHISCRIEKAYCDYHPADEGSPTFCSDRPYPDHSFVLMVLGEDWSDYDGQCIIVSGYLEVHRGALLVQALRHSQVSDCY